MTPGMTARAQRWLHVFREAGWRVELHENMPGMLWKKFAYIAGSAAVCAATNSDYQEMRSIPETERLFKGLSRKYWQWVARGGTDSRRFTHLVDDGARPVPRHWTRFAGERFFSGESR
jgi:ketopantoate reductase